VSIRPGEGTGRILTFFAVEDPNPALPMAGSDTIEREGQSDLFSEKAGDND